MELNTQLSVRSAERKATQFICKDSYALELIFSELEMASSSTGEVSLDWRGLIGSLREEATTILRSTVQKRESIAFGERQKKEEATRMRTAIKRLVRIYKEPVTNIQNSRLNTTEIYKLSATSRMMFNFPNLKYYADGR